MPNIKPISDLRKLLSKLNEAEGAIKTGEKWQSLEDVKRTLGVYDGN